MVHSAQSTQISDILTHLKQNRQADAEDGLRRLTDAGLLQLMKEIDASLKPSPAGRLKALFAPTARPPDTRAKELLDLCLCLFKLQKTNEAAKLLDMIIGLFPDLAEAHAYRGKAFMEAGHIDAAEAAISMSLEIDPRLPRGWFYKGNLLFGLQRFDEAISCYQKACQFDPGFSDAWSNCGLTLIKQQRFHEALPCYERVCILSPDAPNVWAEYGLALSRCEQFKQAIDCYDKALALAPYATEIMISKGIALQDLRRYPEALAVYDDILAQAPDTYKAWLNKGSLLNLFNRPEEALSCYDKAINLDPKDPTGWLCKATCLYTLKRYDEAMAGYEAGLQACPGYGPHLFGQGMTHLVHGRFEEGWPLYLNRWSLLESESPRYQGIPLLTEETCIQGKKILVWHEQGYGDTIQFVRYIPILQRLGTDVTFEVQEPLAGLLKRNYPELKIVGAGTAQGISFDYQVPLLNLPHFFKTDLRSIPQPLAKITAMPEKIAQWLGHIPPSEKLKIGIACSGNSRHPNDIHRSAPLEAFLPLCDLADIYLIQKGVRESDRPVLEHSNMRFPGAIVKDFEDMAAIIAHLDLVVSVDSAPVHLAATMGKPTWLLLPLSPEWRWLLDRQDSPWYPSMRLFRQPASGDWVSVIRDVADALKDFQKKTNRVQFQISSTL